KMRLKSVSLWFLSVVIAALAVALGFWLIPHSRVADHAAVSSPAQHGENNEEIHLVQPGETPAGLQPPAVFQSANRLGANSPAATPRVEPTSETRQLVAGLVELDPSRGPITKEQAESWKQRLQEVVQLGSSGVPAIREFLERNLEHNYAGVPGGELLGHSSLR